MDKKIFDFISSFGMMLLGVFLLLGFSIGVAMRNNHEYHYFPTAGTRQKASAIKFEDYTKTHYVNPVSVNGQQFSGNLSARVALVVDEKTGMVLYSKNPQEVRPLASLTKLMSAMIILELPRDWQAPVTVTNAESICNGDHHVEIGETFSASEMWNAALVGSANKAVGALARTTGITSEGFVSLMNKKATDLGFKSLSFVEPTGLDSLNQGDAEDIAKMLKEALRYPKIKEALSKSECYLDLPKGKQRRVWSTDWLLTNWTNNNFKEVVGKTGYISDSDYNFAVRLTDEKNHSVIVVVLGASTNEARFAEAKTLGEWAFKNFLWPDDTGYKQLVSK